MPEPIWPDDKVMPWGKHKGSMLRELPAAYLLWLFEQQWIKDWPGLYLYLKKNEDLLMSEKRDEHGDDEDEPRTWDDYKNYH